MAFPWVAHPASAASGRAVESVSASELSYYANAHPYFDEPLPQLIKQVPQLKNLHPAGNQQKLPLILQKTGKRVDDFFRDVIDLTAREDISLARLRQERPSSRPEMSGQIVHDSYLILRHGSKTRRKSSNIAWPPTEATSIHRPS